MIQQINLYQERFRQRRVPLDAARLMQLVALFVALLLTATAGLVWQQQRQVEVHGTVLQALAAQEQELARLEAALPAPKEDPRLQESVGRLEQELAARQGFLAHFDNRRLGDTRGFSQLLLGLARQPLPGLWLRRIEIDSDGQLAFEGSALRPDAVPAFVRLLTDESVFQGREFRALQIVEQGGRVDFDLRSRGRTQ